mmetsp:Transcript_63484/g.73843  ORF Transcript_63484/g.73843 Transcript_63484/m.73843 type:complete len:91 (+) Transcript_63484:210-482(+)
MMIFAPGFRQQLLTWLNNCCKPPLLLGPKILRQPLGRISAQWGFEISASGGKKKEKTFTLIFTFIVVVAPISHIAFGLRVGNENMIMLLP